MTVLCKFLDVNGRSCGWFPGIISRIVNEAEQADIDYDDGTYDYDVPFKRLRIRSNRTSRKRSRTFKVTHIPAPTAIVLSIPHARKAVEEALNLIKMIGDEMESRTQDEDGTFSTPTNSRPSTPPAVFTSMYEEDEVEFVMERNGSSRGCASRPIVL